MFNDYGPDEPSPDYNCSRGYDVGYGYTLRRQNLFGGSGKSCASLAWRAGLSGTRSTLIAMESGLAFYAGKWIMSNGEISNLITAFADTDEQAEASIRAAYLIPPADKVYVADISRTKPGDFDNWNDFKGVITHLDYRFLDDQPINGETLFVSGIAVRGDTVDGRSG